MPCFACMFGFGYDLNDESDLKGIIKCIKYQPMFMYDFENVLDMFHAG